MPNLDTISMVKHEMRETTLREAVVGRVGQLFDLHGLEDAMKKFDEMKMLFSGCRDWPDIEAEVTAFFLEKKREALAVAREREQLQNQAWIDGLAKGVATNQLNVMTGSDPHAPYYSSVPTFGGHKQ
jgi:hypothetical protein